MKNDLYFGDEKIERATFEHRVKCLATLLINHGVGPDDAVAVLLRNDTLYLEVIQACRLVGAYYVTLNWHGAAAEIIDILDDSDAKIVIGHSDLTAKLAGLSIPVLAVPTPEKLVHAYGVDATMIDGQTNLAALMDTAQPIDSAPPRFRGMLAYTSGSTGRPKGIRRIMDPNAPDRYETYKALASGLLQLTPGDRFYTAAPLYHSAPNALSLMAVASEFAETYIAPRFDPEGFLADIERYRITHCYLVPTMMVRLLKLPASRQARLGRAMLNRP